MLTAVAANSCTSHRDSAHAPKISPPLPHTPIKIGYWSMVSGLPLFLAVTKGMFQEMGLNVAAVPFSSTQKVAEALINGEIQGFANGTVTSALALTEIIYPSLCKIIALNPRSPHYPIDQMIVARESPIRAIADLKGLRVGCSDDPQHLAITKSILRKNGITSPEIIQLEPSKHILAIQAGHIAAAYNFTGTVTYSESSHGKIQVRHPATRVLETGAFAKYVLGDPMALWAGGIAALTTTFMQMYPKPAQAYITVYRRAIATIRQSYIEALAFTKGYATIEGELAEAVLLTMYKLYDELNSSELEAMQRFFDAMYREQVFGIQVNLASLLYR